VLVATLSQDDLMPNAAPLVAGELGAHRAGAIDVGAACTGFVAALSLGVAQIESGRAGTVLVVGADRISPFVDVADRATAPLFGDGAGALVLTAAASGSGVGPVVLGADSAGAGCLTASRTDALIRMRGPETFRVALLRLSEATLAAVAAAGRTLDEIDLFVFHQGNSRVLSAVGRRLGLPPGKVVDCCARYANTSAASIPIALSAAGEAGRLREGALVLVAAVGAGISWGASVIEWGGGS
jgi:3-oxoacyl-[acyl-carrier-protein] synthase-3